MRAWLSTKLNGQKPILNARTSYAHKFFIYFSRWKMLTPMACFESRGDFLFCLSTLPTLLRLFWENLTAELNFRLRAIAKFLA